METRILIVDDSPFELQLVDYILQEKAYETVTATNGNEALDLLKTFTPDLILLDIMLPDISGFEVCKRIKKVTDLQDIPVIFFTSLANVDDIVKGFEAGGVDYVTKPFNKEELLVRINNHIELRRNKLKIEIQARELKAANDLKDKMFSVISHDLRSPCASIKQTLGFVDSGLLKPGSEDFHEAIQDLLKTSDEASALMENLLGWARSQSNTLKIIPEEIDLADMVDRVIGLFKLAGETKKISMENSVAISDKVYADYNTIKSVIHNLTSNALKFTPQGGRIEFHAKKEGEMIHLSIRDNGVGISEEGLKNLFGVGQQSTYGTNNESGSGLGLLLCKDFIEKNGGEIWVSSEAGKGTKFTFSVPSISQ